MPCWVVYQDTIDSSALETKSARDERTAERGSRRLSTSRARA